MDSNNFNETNVFKTNLLNDAPIKTPFFGINERNVSFLNKQQFSNYFPINSVYNLQNSLIPNNLFLNQFFEYQQQQKNVQQQNSISPALLQHLKNNLYCKVLFLNFL